MAKLPSRFLYNPLHFAAFGFGSGCFPKAPGTMGTLAAIPLYLCFNELSLFWYSLILLLSFGFGVWICGLASTALGVHDHGGIVWDEFVGFWIAMFAAPSGWGWIVLGFVLFRLFDIWKPQPISWLDQKVHGGLGIMLDDVLAGVYAWAVMQLIALFVV